MIHTVNPPLSGSGLQPVLTLRCRRSFYYSTKRRVSCEMLLFYDFPCLLNIVSAAGHCFRLSARSARSAPRNHALLSKARRSLPEAELIYRYKKCRSVFSVAAFSKDRYGLSQQHFFRCHRPASGSCLFCRPRSLTRDGRHRAPTYGHTRRIWHKDDPPIPETADPSIQHPKL